MTRLTSANLKLRTYIHVRSSVAKELDISMSAIGFSRTPFPLQFQPFHRIFLSTMTLIRSPVSSSKIAFFPLVASHFPCYHSIKKTRSKNKKKVLTQNMFLSFANWILHIYAIFNCIEHKKQSPKLIVLLIYASVTYSRLCHDKPFFFGYSAAPRGKNGGGGAEIIPQCQNLTASEINMTNCRATRSALHRRNKVFLITNLHFLVKFQYQVFFLR